MDLVANDDTESQFKLGWCSVTGLNMQPQNEGRVACNSKLNGICGRIHSSVTVRVKINILRAYTKSVNPCIH